MKVIVIGCTHAGTASIVKLKELYPESEVVVYERNDNISFLSCGIALYVGGVIKDQSGLFYSSPEALAEIGVVTRMNHEVTKVDTENKVITVTNLETNEVTKDKYDKLIATTGSWPIIPNIEGIKLENVVLCKNYDHSKAIVEKAKTAKNIMVVGAGYIGVELAESFNELGKNVTLIDMESRILSRYLDKEVTDKAETSFRDHGITLALNDTVKKFEGADGKVSKVVTEKAVYEVDMVVLCIGFKPSTELFKGQLDMLPSGAIKIDEYMRTSKKDVFAAGDSCAVIYNPTDDLRYIPLATNAIRMGTLVAINLLEPKTKYLGTQATSGIKVYNNNIAATGLTEEGAKVAGIDYSVVVVNENNRPEFMPTFEAVTLKMVYDKKTRVLLGGQIVSDVDLTQIANTLSICIQNKMTMDEVAFVDQFFMPHFNKPWGLINVAGLSAK